jgi:hypothetical protein
VTITQTNFATTGTGGATTLSVTTVVGDVVVLFTGVNVSSGVTGVSAPHIGSWVHVLGPNLASWAGLTQDAWVGVATAASTANITCTISGGTATNTSLNAVPFHSDLLGTWSVDKSGIVDKGTGASSTTVTYPSLTPSTGYTDVYCGVTNVSANGTVSGVTAGYTQLTGAHSGNILLHNVAVTTVQAPSYTNSVTTADTCLAVLLNFVVATQAAPFNRAPLRRSSLF